MYRDYDESFLSLSLSTHTMIYCMIKIKIRIWLLTWVRHINSFSRSIADNNNSWKKYTHVYEAWPYDNGLTRAVWKVKKTIGRNTAKASVCVRHLKSYQICGRPRPTLRDCVIVSNACKLFFLFCNMIHVRLQLHNCPLRFGNNESRANNI